MALVGVFKVASKLNLISGAKLARQAMSCGPMSMVRIAWPGLTRRLVQLLAGLC